jgi:hypothetical protein
MAQAQNRELPTPKYGELKTKLHVRLLEELDLDSLSSLDEETARERISQFIRDIVKREKTPLALSEREQFQNENS